jgi:integrase
MAVIQKRIGKKGTSYRVLIRRANTEPISKTFDSKKEAQSWARSVESQMDGGAPPPPVVNRDLSRFTLFDALQRYKNEMSAKKLGGEKEAERISFLQKNDLATRPFISLTSKDYEDYRDARLKLGRAASTVRHELYVFSNLYKAARSDWDMLIPNPLQDVWKPEAWGNPRTERLEKKTDQERFFSAMWEIDTLTTDYQKFVRTMQVAALRFMLEIGARTGEVLKLQWKYVNLKSGSVVIYRPPSPGSRFKGGSREVPLSKKALQILRTLPRNVREEPSRARGESRVFPIDYRTMARVIRKARAHAGLSGTLTSYTLRHERTSNLSNKLHPLELAYVTGHKNLRTTQRYYHPTIEELRKKIG